MARTNQRKTKVPEVRVKQTELLPRRIKFSIPLQHFTLSQKRNDMYDLIHECFGIQRGQIDESPFVGRGGYRDPGYDRDRHVVEIECSADRFVHFLIKRDALGLTNSWKELGVHYEGTPVPRHDNKFSVTG